MDSGPYVLAPHLVDLLASVHASVGAEDNEPAEQMARQNSELLARQNRELVAALHAQQLLVMQQESEMRRLRSALSRSERPIPAGDDHLMGSPTTPFDVSPLGDSHDPGAGGASELALPIPRELHEKLALSVPLQQGLLYAALTLTTNSCTAPIDSSSYPLNCAVGHTTATHRRSLELGALLVDTPPPTLPVSA